LLKLHGVRLPRSDVRGNLGRIWLLFLGPLGFMFPGPSNLLALGEAGDDWSIFFFFFFVIVLNMLHCVSISVICSLYSAFERLFYVWKERYINLVSNNNKPVVSFRLKIRFNYTDLRTIYSVYFITVFTDDLYIKLHDSYIIFTNMFLHIYPNDSYV
jgi:hypothetical protein